MLERPVSDFRLWLLYRAYHGPKRQNVRRCIPRGFQENLGAIPERPADECA